jgi:hypothetical protein
MSVALLLQVELHSIEVSVLPGPLLDPPTRAQGPDLLVSLGTAGRVTSPQFPGGIRPPTPAMAHNDATPPRRIAPEPAF